MISLKNNLFVFHTKVNYQNSKVLLYLMIKENIIKLIQFTIQIQILVTLIKLPKKNLLFVLNKNYKLHHNNQENQNSIQNKKIII